MCLKPAVGEFLLASPDRADRWDKVSHLAVNHLYVGVSGVELSLDQFEFDDGVIVRKTYAHVMAPYLAAFAPAPPGEAHPPPWAAIGGGLGFDITVEIEIPTAETATWAELARMIWRLLALIRLRSSPLARVPVIASDPFARIPEMTTEPQVRPFEMGSIRLIPESDPSRDIDQSSLEWIRMYLPSVNSLVDGESDFAFAFQAFDQCSWTGSSSLGLVMLWAALERLFAASAQELTFRLSTTIASYLEEPGEERMALYKQIRSLYRTRSQVVHGTDSEPSQAFRETYQVLKRTLTKMIEETHVPDRDELERRLFGAE
jgi:hypothetical protein